MKRCSRCKMPKSKSDFYRATSHSDGLTSECKECNKKGVRIRYQNNKGKILARAQRWRDNNQEYLKISKRNYHIKTAYGLSPEQYEALLKKADHKCQICRAGLLPRKTVIDHDHKTGKVRGIICGKCNRAMAGLGDSIDGLTAALNYLLEAKNNEDTE